MIHDTPIHIPSTFYNFMKKQIEKKKKTLKA